MSGKRAGIGAKVVCGIGIRTTLDSGIFGQSQIVNGSAFSGNSQGANCSNIYGEVVLVSIRSHHRVKVTKRHAQVVADVFNIHRSHHGANRL